MDFTSAEIEKIKEISEELEIFRKKLISIDYIHDKEEFFSEMKKFRKYLVEIDVWRNFDVFYHSKFYKFYSDFFTGIHDYYTRALESMQSLSVMTKWIHNFSSFYDLLDRELIRESFERKTQELESIDFSSAKNFVFAWCWPFPETLLYVYENTDIENILWLDYNHEAIYMAGEVINWLRLEHISFKHIDATLHDYSDADIVSIPLFVAKKDEIVNQVIETWKKWIQISVRSPKWFLNMIYKWLSENITPRAVIVCRKDVSSDHVNEEIIKLEKYDF